MHKTCTQLIRLVQSSSERGFPKLSCEFCFFFIRMSIRYKDIAAFIYLGQSSGIATVGICMTLNELVILMCLSRSTP